VNSLKTISLDFSACELIPRPFFGNKLKVRCSSPITTFNKCGLVCIHAAVFSCIAIAHHFESLFKIKDSVPFFFLKISMNNTYFVLANYAIESQEFSFLKMENKAFVRFSIRLHRICCVDPWDISEAA